MPAQAHLVAQDPVDRRIAEGRHTYFLDAVADAEPEVTQPHGDVFRRGGGDTVDRGDGDGDGADAEIGQRQRVISVEVLVQLF